MLIHLDRNNISNKMLKDAIIETSKHRETFEMINNKEIVEEVISSLKNDDSMIKQWEKYQKTYEYAKDINYIDLIESVNMVKEIYFK
jgi:hypothetical protein